jgi:DNA polymerase III delta prime subunit
MFTVNVTPTYDGDVFPLLSTILKFKPISITILEKYIIKICFLENMKITQKALDLIVIYCEGDLRKLLNILQSLNMNNYKNNDKLIKRKDVSKLILFPSRKTILKYINITNNNNLYNSFNIIRQDITNNDFVLNEIINQSYDLIIDCIINKNYNYFTKEKMIIILKKIMIINALVNAFQLNALFKLFNANALLFKVF